MAFSDLTFKFYTDSGLTVAFSNIYQLIHYTDLSDNPQDFTLYFGSAQSAGTRSLKATSNPGVDSITLTPTLTLATYAASTAYSDGDVVQPTTPNGYRYTVTTAGTSGVEPTWPTTLGSTVTSGSATFTLYSARHPASEIKLALSSGGLAGATGGSALSLATTILSGTANAVPVYIRVTNSVSTVSDTTGYPDIKLYMNEVIEQEV